jgi:hypothetical protein
MSVTSVTQQVRSLPLQIKIWNVRHVVWLTDTNVSDEPAACNWRQTMGQQVHPLTTCQTIWCHISEHTVIVVLTPVRTWNIKPAHLLRWRFTAIKACQFVTQIHKVQALLWFQNRNILGRSTRRETKERMMGMTPGAPSVARSSQTLTSEYLDNEKGTLSDSVHYVTNREKS